jgi:hypothetical protein
MLKKLMTKSIGAFLLKCLKIRGFNSTWCAWIKSVLENGTLAVKVNNTISHVSVFCTGKLWGGKDRMF